MIEIFSVFPGLFFLTPLAITLLRIAAAYAFLYMANSLVQDRHEIARIRLPIIGHVGEGLVWLAAILVGLIGCMLAVGLYTQVAAIFGMLFVIKHWFWSRWYRSAAGLSRGTLALVFVICLSLLITGAGAFAFDLPL
ncbi:DoxX family membrane protein [Candidatus Kaiserbacteria bacterium]|nr:DoxX family membrane protein [Candidatus Kaiserbacteria bacterium]